MFHALDNTAIIPVSVQWVPGLSRGKERPGRDADPLSPSSAVGHERVELYLYSPLWAVRPVQSLSACTRVHFTSLPTSFGCYDHHQTSAIHNLKSLVTCSA